MTSTDLSPLDPADAAALTRVVDGLCDIEHRRAGVPGPTHAERRAMRRSRVARMNGDAAYSAAWMAGWHFMSGNLTLAEFAKLARQHEASDASAHSILDDPDFREGARAALAEPGW